MASVETTYQKKSQHEHVLLRPDTYVGSIEPLTETQWVLSGDKKGMLERDVTYVPGLYKIFDEILVNAADNKQRDGSVELQSEPSIVDVKTLVDFSDFPATDALQVLCEKHFGARCDSVWRDTSSQRNVGYVRHNEQFYAFYVAPNMTEIRVKIDQTSGRITVRNDGKGIPVQVHKEYKMYVPELVFGNLLTSSNYDDKKKKTTGGRNGFGAKLTNIFSTEFTISAQDSWRGLLYSQHFKNNMFDKEAPVVKKLKRKSNWTEISFVPDFKRFGIPGITPDMLAQFEKRLYDIAGTTRGVSVYFQDVKLPVRSFKQYVALYFDESDSKRTYVPFSTPDGRWEVVVSNSTQDQFQQVSFVNSVCTTKGGQHVNYIASQVMAAISKHLASKKKKEYNSVRAHQIKQQCFVFVNALIENPTFDGQTKETLMSRRTAFGSQCKLDDKCLNKIVRSDIVNSITRWALLKSQQALSKQDGSKSSRILVPKLFDANWAGTAKSDMCTLILTEGDSAKALVVSGFSVLGRDQYGVFPLRGKLLNVRDASAKQIAGNAEVCNLKKILGLKQGKVYTDSKELRYGHVMVMTDQDHDGSHIKGLLINIFHKFWPSLLKIPGFLVEFITPIVVAQRKVRREGSLNKRSFFTIPEYKTWKRNQEQDGTLNRWTIKYYKGLGTSTAAEGKEYFSDMARHQIDFKYSGPECDAKINMAFSNKAANQRKAWLASYVPGTYLDQDIKELSYAEFIAKELILFSIASNKRAIPSLMDGLKPGQRKILHGCFKRRLTKQIKVVQLSGYVSEHCAYHHGETALSNTIVGMAHAYTGSNNVHLLSPEGQFGTRHENGKDAASSRYIFTQLSPVTRLIFRAEDDGILNYLDDDGQSVEPLWFAPVLPMTLVNGAKGIGTGWSTELPNFRPTEVVANLERLMNDVPLEPMVPWYRNFQGSIDAKGIATGVAEQVSDRCIEITEIPLKSTVEYIKFLMDLSMRGVIRNYEEHHGENSVRFRLIFTREKLKVFLAKGPLIKTLKLTKSIPLHNMVLFNANDQLEKFDNPLDILRAFFSVRLELYGKRKAFMGQQMKDTLAWQGAKIRFILEVLKGTLKIKNVKKAALVQLLRAKGYPIKSATPAVDAKSEVKVDQSGYNYLLGMPLWSLTFERVQALRASIDKDTRTLAALEKKTAKDLWRADLAELKPVLIALERPDAIDVPRTTKRTVTRKRKRAASVMTQLDTSTESVVDSIPVAPVAPVGPDEPASKRQKLN